MDRATDWMRQAERDVEQARWVTEGGFYESACFLSQQAAEKAAKALCQALRLPAWGHAVLRLLQSVSEVVPVEDDLLDAARVLDRHYIPTRYPNGFDEGTAADYYTEDDAQGAIERAERIVEFCRQALQA